MKKMNKGAAVVGALALALAALLHMINQVRFFSFHLESGNIYQITVNLALHALLYITVCVGLFRAKKDIVGAVCLGSGGVLYVIYLVSSFSVGSLLALAVFVLLVLCCLDVLKLPKPLGTIVIAVPAVIAALLWLDSYLRVMFTDSHGAFATKSFFWMLRDPRQLSSFLIVIASYLLKGVGLALAGVAVTVQPKEKPAPFANSPYAPVGAAQAYAPQYQAPQYQQPQYQQPQYQQPQYQQPPREAAKRFGYIDILTHVLLCLFTCGIWTLIWIYRTSKTLSNVPGEKPQDPVAQLLLCMFVPFYIIFWLYGQGKRAELYCRSVGIHAECATMCLLFAFLIPLVSYILLQSTVNKAAEALGAGTMYR